MRLWTIGMLGIGLLSVLADAQAPATLPAATLTVDKEKRTVTIPAAIAPRKLDYLQQIYPIEVVACWPHPQGKKAHETVVVFTVKPSEVHKALESLGLKPGKTAEGEDGIGSGPELKINLEFPGADGQPKLLPLEKTLIDKKTGKGMPMVKWFFTGSVISQLSPDKDEKILWRRPHRHAHLRVPGDQSVRHPDGPQVRRSEADRVGGQQAAPAPGGHGREADYRGEVVPSTEFPIPSCEVTMALRTMGYVTFTVACLAGAAILGLMGLGGIGAQRDDHTASRTTSPSAQPTATPTTQQVATAAVPPPPPPPQVAITLPGACEDVAAGIGKRLATPLKLSSAFLPPLAEPRQFTWKRGPIPAALRHAGGGPAKAHRAASPQPGPRWPGCARCSICRPLRWAAPCRRPSCRPWRYRQDCPCRRWR